jgi:hypothetical protein
MILQDIQDHPAEGIIPDLSHEGYIGTQELHGKTRVGHGPAGMDIRFPYMDQFSGF